MIPTATAHSTDVAELRKRVCFWQAEAEGLREERDALHAALTELVTLKRMKGELSLMLLREEGGMGLDYDRRKPLAWQRARELVGSNVEVSGAGTASAGLPG